MLRTLAPTIFRLLDRCGERRTEKSERVALYFGHRSRVSVAVEPSGMFAYVFNPGSNNVSAYAIDANKRRADTGERLAV